MKVLLFANGAISQGAALRRALAEADGTRIICADGGALHARALGLQPHTIIGDLDSLTAAEVANFRAAGSQVLSFPAEKDETDLELALLHCREIGAKSVTIIGALGGRFDQTVANLYLLTLPAISGMRIILVDGDQTVRVLSPGIHSLEGEAGDTISLIPLSASADGIRTHNLKYPLNDESLLQGPARGISNVMLAERAEVSFRQGRLLLVHSAGRA
ncbi:MAG: thiamine diphosphokinase [Chloroflexi bacterium]|nr:thiamine diphosphokinase [Chloroflexota bacterium]